MADQEGPKIIVDTDWKSQAQAEKDRLAASEKTKAPARPAAGPPGAPEGADYGAEAPTPDFTEIIRMIATQALMYLGAFPEPETGKRFVSLEMAQFNIELLTTLEAKTKGNLTAEESTFLTRMLYELRMQYVEIGKAVAKAVEQGRIAPSGVAGVGPGAGMAPELKIQPGPRV